MVEEIAKSKPDVENPKVEGVSTSSPSTFLEKVQAERKELEELRESTASMIKELRELRAEEIISGTSNAGKSAVKEEISDVEYAKQALEGKIGE